MSLSARILIGLCLGIAVGVFFGEIVAPVRLVGRGFILLLQMTVLPYVAVSLIRALGSLSAREAIDLVRKVGGFLLLFWAVGLLTVALLPLMFPAWTSASFFSQTLVEPSPPFDFLGLFIPANPFASLANNVVPAVVVFSVSLGVALIGMSDAAPIIRAMGVLTEALGRIAGFVVRLAPLGVFAIAAEAGGTMKVQEIQGLQVYLAAYVVAALFLSLWVLPGLVSVLTPFRYREVVGMTRDALVTAFATGNVFVVLSLLSEKAKGLARQRVERSEESEAFVEVVVPTAYTLPSVGKLMALSFVPFAGWLSGFPVPLARYPALALSGLFSFFGNTLVAIPILLDQFRVPSDTFQLFVIADSVVGNRFGSLLAAMHILCLCLLAASAVAGVLVFRWVRILRFAAITSVLGMVLFLGVRLGFESWGHQYEGYDLFVKRGLLWDAEPSRVLQAPPQGGSGASGLSTLERVRQRGVLRAGFRRDSLPSAFVNDAGELVGFDVELLYVLARELGVNIEFAPMTVGELPRLLASGSLDIATGVAITPSNMQQLSLSAPYIDQTLAFIVPDYRRSEFNTREAVKRHETLRLGIPRAPYYIDKVRSYLPQATIVEMDSPRPFFRKQLDVDAIVFSAESGSAWCLIYPEFSVAVPQPDLLRVPFGFPVAYGDAEMVAFLNNWIELKRRDGSLEILFDYWLRGLAQERRTPRWSVIRDVLHWVD